MPKMSGDERRRMLLEDSMYKVIPTLAIPSIIAMLVDSIYNLADTYFVSSIGESATAAVAVNDSFMNVLTAICAGFGFGASSCLSRMLGAKKDQRASELASSVLVVALSVCAVSIALIFPFRTKVIRFFGVTEESLPYAIDYAQWILFAFPFTTSTMLLGNYLKSEGNSRYSMVGTATGCVINCILDPIFIRGLGLEVAGAAIATAISKMISVCVLAVPFIKGKTIIKLSPRNCTMNKRDIFEVMKVGFPSFLRSTVLSGAAVITNNVAKAFGTAVLAGISVANKIYRMISSLLLGFGQGFSPVVGFCWGAKKYSRVKDAYKTTLKIGAVLSISLGVVVYFFAGNIINIFNSSGNPMVTEIGSAKLKLLCLAFFPHVFTVITDSAYQALGKAVPNMLLGMSRQIFFLIPLMLILPKFWGAYGVAYAQGIADFAAALFVGLPFSINYFIKMGRNVDGETATF